MKTGKAEGLTIIFFVFLIALPGPTHLRPWLPQKRAPGREGDASVHPALGKRISWVLGGVWVLRSGVASRTRTCRSYIQRGITLFRTSDET